MIPFKAIEASDKEIITSYTLSGNYRDNGLSFCNLYGWHFLTESGYAIIDNMLVIRYCHYDGNYVYTLPFGEGDKKKVIEQLQAEVESTGKELHIYGSLPFLKNVLEEYMPNRFDYDCNPDFSDYLYLRTDLVELKGNSYQPKRNHINKFRKNYEYEYEPLSAELVPQCLELAQKWCYDHDCDKDENLRHEKVAMHASLKNFEALGITGAAIRVKGDIVGFTYGSPVTNDTFCIHIEKGDTKYNGIYALINNEFASRIPEQYIYINREEDLGIPGLRKAKQSYHPILLLEKCIATFKK